jgi:hypothetical protein
VLLDSRGRVRELVELLHVRELFAHRLLRGGLKHSLVHQLARLARDLREVSDDRVVLLDLVRQELIGVGHEGAQLSEPRINGRRRALHGGVDSLKITMKRGQLRIRCDELIVCIV